MKTTPIIALLCVSALGCAPTRLVAKLVAAPAPQIDYPALRSPPAANPTAEIAERPWHVSRLPNGMRVVVVPRPLAPSVAIAIQFDRGALDLNDAAGLKTEETRFLYAHAGHPEALALRKAEARTLGEEAVSYGDADGWTTSIQVLPLQLAEGMRVLARSSFAISLWPQEFERQAAAWQRSRVAGWMSKDDLIQHVLFGSEHPYGFVIPDRNVVSMSQAREIYEQIVRQSHATIVAVGNVSVEQVEATARAVFGDAAGPPPIPARVPPVPNERDRRLALAWSWGSTQVETSVVARLPASTDPAFDSLRVAVELFAGMPSSNLYQRLRNEMGAVYGASAHVEPGRAASAMLVNASVERSKFILTVNVMLEALSDVREGRVSDAAFETAKRAVVGQWRLQMETPYATATAIASAVERGEDLEQLRTFGTRVSALSKAQVVEAAARHLPASSVHVLLQGRLTRFDLEPLNMGVPTTIEFSR